MPRSEFLLLSLYLALLSHSASALAQDDKTSPDAIPIGHSRSPDGQKEMVIVDHGYEGSASGTVQIRETKTGKLLSYFDWSGFGEHVTADAFTVLWRSDSRAFAIQSEITRGYSECKVYALENGVCYPVQLPNFVKAIADRYHLGTASKGSELPVKWLPNNRLVLDVYNRGFGEESPYHYEVTLQLPAHPVASVETIHPVR